MPGASTGREEGHVMSTPHPSLTTGLLWPSRPFGSVSPWAPSSLMVSGSSPAALVFPFAKAQPGAADEGGASPGGRTAAVLGWAGLGAARPASLLRWYLLPLLLASPAAALGLPGRGF